ncbi:MAG TPA: N-acetylglucosamine-6-phosphate deacetylase [Vicinamibacterales bacterium]|nr:N-acetylglucosamine-6-phosphate deacetylase [Vicinamibacterales bacterium]
MPDAGPTTVVTGASLVLPDRVASGVHLVVEGDRIVALHEGPIAVEAAATYLDRTGSTIVPGFIDVHVHGALGHDVLDSADALAAVARALPQWGVTAFCPTAVAAPPDVLDRFLAAVGALRASPIAGAARVLPAHLETNFIHPEYRGAQPLAELRRPARLAGGGDPDGAYSARDVLAAIDRHRADVAIATLAPELEGAHALIRSLRAAGIRVSLGHSSATFDEAQAAIALGATQATHLFNRMAPMSHREPGLAGAVLASDAIVAEIIGDGVHVHPAMVRATVAAKGVDRVMAITDATAGAGLPAGARSRLGGQAIVVGDAARLEDGTLAGSVATMDGVFRWLVNACGLDLVQAAQLTSTTPARTLGLVGMGLLAAGARADFTVLDSNLRVVETWIGGRPGTRDPAYPSSEP